jgi:hypothetical protein
MTPHALAAAEMLMRHLGLAKRTTAEVQDLYSRPQQPMVGSAPSAGPPSWPAA